jgi:hypothetical protein
MMFACHGDRLLLLFVRLHAIHFPGRRLATFHDGIHVALLNNPLLELESV